MRRFVWVLIIAVLIGALPVMAQGGEDGEIVGPEDFPPGVNPLTGLPVENEENLDRRPLLVKISNWPPVVRPQSGLSQADHVWEILVEGGVTRFAAVFLGNDVDHLGPVRSARLADLPLVRYYSAIYGYSGAAQGTLDRIRADRVVAESSIGGGPCPPYCRFPEPGMAYEHTLYTTTAALHEAAADEGMIDAAVNLGGMAFQEVVPAGGTEAEAFTLNYRQTRVEWTYDAESGLWLRSQDDEPQIDENNDERLTAANVVIFETFHVEQDPVAPDYWGTANYAFEITLVGEGRVVLFRDGQFFTGRWERPDADSRLTFVDDNGDPLLFRPGSTWFQLVPAVWFNGYQLLIDVTDPPQVVVNAASLNLRTGPGTGFGVGRAAVRGDTLEVLGRDSAGAWAAVRFPGEDTILWTAADYLDFGDIDPLTLPIAVNTN